MEIRIAGKRERTIHVGFYELGTEKILAAAVKNESQDGIEDARLWTAGLYKNYLGIRLAGGPTWTYPGGSSRDAFELGDMSAGQEIAIEIQLNLPASPGRYGENYVPLFMGHGGKQ